MAIIQNQLNQATGDVDPKVFAGSSNTPNATTNSSGVGGYNPAKAEATLGSINFDTDTVEGRTNNILKSGSPLMERAKGLADQRSNERGLINSSLSTGAAQTAMLDQAVPIATTDAAAMNNQRLTNQSVLNQVDQVNVDSINAGQKMQLGAKLDMDKQGAAFAQDMEKQRQAAALELQRMDRAFAQNMDLRLKELAAQDRSQKQQSNYNAALQVSTNLVSEINRINADANFDGAAKIAQVAAAKTAAASQINYLSRLSGVDYGDLMAYYVNAGGANVGSVLRPGEVAPTPFYNLSFNSAPAYEAPPPPNWAEQG